MKRKRGEAEGYLDTLTAMPAWAVELSAHLSEDQARWKPSKKDWSLRQVFAHLEACAVLWQRDIRLFIEITEPEIESPHPRTIQFSTELFQATFRVAALRYNRERLEFLALFADQDGAIFDRSGLINGHRQTVFEQVRRIAKHEERHQEQVSSLLAALQSAPPSNTV